MEVKEYSDVLDFVAPHVWIESFSKLDESQQPSPENPQRITGVSKLKTWFGFGPQEPTPKEDVVEEDCWGTWCMVKFLGFSKQGKRAKERFSWWVWTQNMLAPEREKSFYNNPEEYNPTNIMKNWVSFVFDS